MSSTELRNGKISDEILNVVMIYDDLDNVARATSALGRLAPQSTVTPTDVTTWSLKALNSTQSQGEEAEYAHLLMLALSRRESLSDWLLDWLYQWVTRRRVIDAMLVWNTGWADTSRLTAFALRHQLHFTFDCSAAIPEPVLAQLHERETMALAEPSSAYYRGWGLNT
jgi:hypothetical protein